MPKRKRSAEESVEEKFASLSQDLHRALKTTKGFERQRQAKRLRDSKGVPDKIQRLEREVAVLKSLDLHQAAHAHLCSSLLKIKAVAESPGLPEEIRSGVPKPDISEEEKTALHNVTSALYNKKEVRDVVAKAIPAICAALGVPVPEKKGKGKKARPDGRPEKEEQPADRDAPAAVAEAPAAKRGKQTAQEEPALEPAAEDGKSEDEEEAVSRFEAMLGGSSEGERSDSESDEEDDPMAITSDEEEEEEEWEGIELSGSDIGESGDADEVKGKGASVSVSVESSDDDDDEESISISPPPKKRVAKSASASKQGWISDSTFLPTLMGGYISGSESASDVDVEPPRKNRRGQRARQAIWEKKYKEKAKHLGKESKDKDHGWDPRRGAVDDSSKPWKRGIKTPFGAARRQEPEGANSEPLRSRTKPSGKPDDTGPLHPSWEARKKAKEKEETAKFEGKKITFD